MENRNKPNTEQLQALRSYAAAHGRTWKSQLNHSWTSGSYWPSDDSGPLQQVRNQFGPSWLVRFKLTKITTPTTPHVHHYTIGSSRNVETCPCGAFRFTEKGLTEYGPAIEAVEAEVIECDLLDEDPDLIEEADEPEEGDWTTADHRTFTQYGYPHAWRDRLEVPEDADWRVVLQARMDAEGFFPNVWFISDHGNAHLLSMEVTA